MADLWNIYRADGQQLGPFSPSEVREALREGTADPFDQVARVGSRVKQTLVEVDAIFEDEITGKVDSVYDQNDSLVNKGHNLQPTAHQQAKAPRQQATAHSPRRLVPKARKVADGPQPANRQVHRSQRHAKRFYLSDRKNRLLGPLSAPEIQSLYYRGVIDANIEVSKGKSNKRVPVQKFIAAYVGAKAQRFKSDNTRLHLNPLARYHHAGGKFIRYASRSAAALRRRKETSEPWFSILFLMLALAVAGVMVLSLDRLNHHHQAKQDAHKEVGEQQPKPETGHLSQGDALLLEPVTGIAATSVPVVTRQPTPPPLRGRPAAVSPPLSKPAPEVAKEPRAKKAATAAKRSSKRPDRRPQTAVKPRPVVPRRVVQRRVARPEPSMSRPQLSQDPYASKVGSVVAISGLRYSPADVSRCSGMKCTIPARDTRGTVFLVVFFRDRYQGQLVSRSGNATISGRLAKKGSAYYLYLNGVR